MPHKRLIPTSPAGLMVAAACLAMMAPVLAFPGTGLAAAETRWPSRLAGAQLAQPVIAWTCVDKGKRLRQGAQVCLNTPKGPRMAVCGKVLNNSAWRISSNICQLQELSSD